MDFPREDTLDAFSSESTVLTVEPCSNCGRKFNPDSLARHERICNKTSQKSRKVFNSSKQRAEGTDIPTVTTRKHTTAPTARKPEPTGKKNNWREKHENFISAIRNARQVQKAIDSGGPLPPPPPPTINPDYVQCPYCDRRFNENAANRHMPFCKEQHERLPKNKPSAQASQKWNSMKQYKAPKLKSRGSAGGSGGLSPPSSGYGPVSTSPSRQPTQNRSGNIRSTRSGGGMNGGLSSNSSRQSMQSGFGSDDPTQGQALRTGRTAQTYSEARQLSAKQRATMNNRNNGPTYNGSPYSSSIGSPTSPHPPGQINNNYGSPDTRYNNRPSSGQRAGSGAAKFCHECGTKYPVPHAKFCCECGIKRVVIS